MVRFYEARVQLARSIAGDTMAISFKSKWLRVGVFVLMVLMAMVAMASLTGCGNSNDPSDPTAISSDNDEDDSQQFPDSPPPQHSAPVQLQHVDAGPGADELTSGSGSDPGNAHSSLSQDDPLLAGNQDVDAGKDALISDQDQVTPHVETPLASPLVGGRQVHNWYWIRGDISGGRVEVSINHVSVGSFTAHLDHEVTDQLRRGINEVEFTQIPDTPFAPVRAHLDVVYSQQPKGAPPVLEYDAEKLAVDAGSGDGSGGGAGVIDPAANWKTPQDSFSRRYQRQTDNLDFDAE